MATEPSKPTPPINPDTGNVSLRDTVGRYGRISRFNHWFGTALVLIMLGIGLYFEDMPKGDRNSTG